LEVVVKDIGDIDDMVEVGVGEPHLLYLSTSLLEGVE